MGDAEQSVTYADRSGDAFRRRGCRVQHVPMCCTRRAAGAEAEARFREAERMQAESQPDYPLLYSLQGFRYCDLLLTEAERAAWQVFCSGGLRPPEAGDAHRATLQAVSERAAQTLKWADVLGERRSSTSPSTTSPWAAPRSTRRFWRARHSIRCRAPLAARRGRPPPRRHHIDHLPRGLLTRAWLRFLEGKRTGPESAQSDLDEAWEIAERGPMKLHMADIHLHRARLFFREAQYPWGSPAANLAAARELIEKCGYGRRKRSWRMPSGRLAGAELNPLLASPFVRGGGWGLLVPKLQLGNPDGKLQLPGFIATLECGNP